jgi:hypothetical protein
VQKCAKNISDAMYMYVFFVTFTNVLKVLLILQNMTTPTQLDKKKEASSP